MAPLSSYNACGFIIREFLIILLQQLQHTFHESYVIINNKLITMDLQKSLDTVT